MRVLNVGQLPAPLLARLAAAHELHDLTAEPDRKAWLARHGGDVEGLITSGGAGADAALIDALPKLRVISNFGVGVDKIDLAAAQRRGIVVGYTPDVLNDCVADLGFALLLDVARRTVEADRYVRRGDWLKGSFPLGRKVSGAKLGIVGMGRIGQTVARRSAGFEMDVRYHTRRPVEGLQWPHEPSLPELARWCDFLVVITAGGPGTRHLINAAVLDALGPSGYLINISRGSVVDEAALVAALTDRRIAGAGLDVYEDEPNVPAALMALDNVVLLPHIASGTVQTRQAMADRVFDNLQSFCATGRVLSAAPTA